MCKFCPLAIPPDAAPAASEAVGLPAAAANATAAQGAHKANQDIAAHQPDDAAYRSAIQRADRYKPLTAALGQNQQIVAGPLLFGLCATGYALPCPHTPASLTFVLVSDSSDVCECAVLWFCVTSSFYVRTLFPK